MEGDHGVGLMKIIIAGTRTFEDYDYLKEIIDKYKDSIDTIISGTARGADSLGERYAIENNIKLEKYPADWNKYGKSAGYKRNELMAEKGDMLIAFWDGKSKGTMHMINIMRNLKKDLRVIQYEVPS